MSFGQSGCNVVKGGEFNSSADAANWSFQTVLTGWYRYGNEAYIEVDGASNISLKQNVTSLLGNTLTLTFKFKGQNADRMNCGTSGTLDVKIGGTTYMRITNPTNNTTITNANIVTFNGASYTPLTGLSLTVGGSTLPKPPIPESALGQGTIVLTIPSWTGGTTADLEFVASSSNSLIGSGNCLTTTGGDDWFIDDVKLTASDPTDFVMTGSNGCAGTNTAMGLNNSQVGVSYQLQRNGTNVGSVYAGTGAAISLGTQSTAGTYTVVAIVGSANCKTMIGSVLINSVPTVSNAGADQIGLATCGLTSVTLAANTPTSGTGIWSIVSGTGGTVTTPTSPTSTFTGTVGTSYILRWTISNSPCTASTDEVTIRINQSPTVSITGNNYICAGSTTTLSPTTGGIWTSSNDLVATVNNAGLVTGVATGSATFTFTSSVAPGCTATTPSVTVSTGLSTIYNTSGSFTVPAGVTSLQVECWGGGGAGGGSSATNVKGGGGGAGGAYIMGTIPVSAGSYTVTVGAVRPGTAAAGAQGNPSWFGSTSTIYAEGGAGGSAPNNTTVSGGTGSSASTITNGTLITKSPGSNGANGTTTIGGAGGNGANTTSPEGLGGAQRTTNENDGNAGVAPGGGGGGAFLTDATDHIGGAGGAGRVRITIASPTATAGGSQTICQTGTATVSGASSSNGTIAWTHNGAGSLSNETTLTPTYTPATGDIGNTVILTMTVSNGPCVTPATATYSVIVNATATATISGTATVCQGGSAPNIIFTNPLNRAITVTYNINGGTSATVNVGANTTATVAAPTGTSGTFVYNLVSAVYQAAPTCSASLTGSATITVRPTVTASISGTASVCQGGSTPNVTFTNPLSEVITVTYNINGGTSATVNVGASTTATVSAPTGTAGTFVYNLVSAVYQAAPTCSASLTGSATVTVRPTVTASISGTASVCQGGSTPNVTFTNPLNEAITVTYNINGGTSATVNVGANTTATVSAPTGTSGTFVYNLVSAVYQSAPTCSASLTGSATITVRPTVTASISGTTSVCLGAGTPNIIFTNPLSEAITVTYNINGGTSATVNVGASTTATVAAPTGTAGTFVYNLVSAVYQAAPTCSASLTGSATVTVRPTVTASISGTASVCQGGSTPNVTFTNPLNEAITVTYNINGGTSATVNVGASTTATVAAPTGTSGTFVYNLVSAVYQTAPTCSASLTGSATVTVRPTVTASISGTTLVCQGGSTPNVTFANPLSEAITVTYNINGGTSATVKVGASTTATVAAPTGTSGTFVYNLVSAVYQTAPTCSASLTGSATVTVRPTVTASISGTTSVCQGGSTPNVTFTNPLSEAITVTYNINGGTSATLNVGANTTASVAAPTGTAGAFVYNLVSAVYQAAPTCSASLTGSATVTVRPTVTASISGTALVCQGGSTPNVTFTNPLSEAITVTYNINGGTSATVNVGANTIATVAAPTGTSGTFVYNLVSAVYQAAPTCSASLTGSATVTVQPTPSTPTVGTTTHISCTTNTGSVILSDLPSSGSWTITSTPVTVITTGSGTSTTISGLAIGSYTFTVTNDGGCPSAASSTVDIFDYTSTTWNGSGWSNGVPNASKNIIIDSVTPNSPFTVDLQGCALTINNGVIATVSSGITLTITNAVTTNGQLIFENNASLVQINNVANSGSIVYKRISYPMKNFDATYWSSPVAGQTLIDLSPNTLSDKYIAYYNSVWKTEARTNVMKPGIGYAIRVPKPNYWPIPTATTYAQPVEFKGVPNNGNITSSQAVTAGKYYLIGNPYPSALDAREFLYSNVNNNTVLNGTIYFWTHNTAMTPSGTVYVYSSNDYASFNATGGTATTGANNSIPSGYIAAGQSFMASAKANGTVQFDNSMRVGGADNAQFFKPGKSSKSSGFESHRLWLNMTNSGGAFKQTLIGYVAGATNSYDVNFDGETFDGNTYIDFYSVNTTNKLTIQGRALPFTNTDLVPLGYRSTIAGDFTISIDKADGNLATQRVYLEDKQTGTINELTAGNYVFTTKAGTFNDRFVLRYSSNTLGTGDFEVADDAVWVKIANKTVSVNSTSENIDKVFIYDLSGKQLYVKEDVNNLQLLIENLPFAQQALLVKVVLDNGYQTTKKVVFN
ncbi:glycine-rich domain-containing protein [Flavobacterium chungangense]|nr:T9SS sorting signal type C domain-containing protein [Flavobacterium chungangense]